MYSLPASFSQSDESPHDVMLPPVQSHDGSVEDGTVVPGARLVVAGTDDVAFVGVVIVVVVIVVVVCVAGGAVVGQPPTKLLKSLACAAQTPLLLALIVLLSHTRSKALFCSFNRAMASAQPSLPSPLRASPEQKKQSCVYTFWSSKRTMSGQQSLRRSA